MNRFLPILAAFACVSSSALAQTLVVTGNVTLTNQTFQGVTSAGFGGAILVEGASPTLVENIIEGNQAGDGGGIYLTHTSSTPPASWLDGTTVSGNTAGFGAGFFVAQEFSGTAVDFSSNTTDDGYMFGFGSYTFGANTTFTCDFTNGCQ